MKQRFSLFILILVTVLPLSSQSLEDSLNVYLNKKQFRQAIALGSRLMQNDQPISPQSIYSLGQAYEGIMRYREAAALYNKVYEQDSLNTEYIYAKARVANNMGEFDNAEMLYQRIVREDSTDFFANNQLYYLYIQKKDYNSARDHLSRLLQADEENHVLWRRMGDFYSEQQLYGNAYLYYITAMNRNKNDWQAAHSLINSLLHLGEEEIKYALVVCDTAQLYNPDNIYLKRDRANIHYVLKEFEVADSLYSILIEEGDSTYQVVKYLGAARFNSKKYFQSIEPLELAHTIDSLSIEVNLLLGAALGKTYDSQMGLTLLHRVDSLLRPNPAIVMLSDQYKAEIMMKRKETEELGITLYYDIYKKDSSRLDIIYALTSSYLSGTAFKNGDNISKQKGLFLISLTAERIVKTKNQSSETLNIFIKALQPYLEEMFFTGHDTYPTLSPDGKKGSISIKKINLLIKQLKEYPMKE